MAVSQTGAGARRFEISLAALIGLSLLLGTLATLLYYTYGEGNQVSELPIVLRALDSAYLPGDFYTDATSGFGPRYYFAHGLKWMTGVDGLPLLLFALVLICNCAIALISALAARDFGGSNLAGALAACFVLSVTTFSLGAAEHLFAREAVTSRLVVAPVLLTVWAGIRRWPLVVAAAAGLATLIHPTFGLEAGALAFAIMLIVGDRDRGTLGAMIVGGVLFAIFASFQLVPYLSAPRIPAAEFIDIEAHLRHPHRDLPSTFLRFDYFAATAYLLVLAVAWIECRRRGAKPDRLWRMAALVGFILLLCAGGYVFVELFPLRSWVIARPFRLLLLVKWSVLVLVAAQAASLLQDRRGTGALAFWPQVLSLLTPATALSWQLARTARSVAGVHRPGATWGAAGGFLLAGGILVRFAELPATEELQAFATMLAITLAATVVRSRWVSPATVAATVALLLGLGPVARPTPVSATAAGLGSDGGPGVQPACPDPHDDAMCELAPWAERHTPEDALFLAPPDFGRFRLLAKRALVVDFKAYPFQDHAMREWRQRLADCYGTPSRGGYAALAEFELGYRDIDDAKIAELRRRYGLTHAILHEETETRLRVIHRAGDYKIVHAGRRGDAPARQHEP